MKKFISFVLIIIAGIGFLTQGVDAEARKKTSKRTTTTKTTAAPATNKTIVLYYVEPSYYGANTRDVITFSLSPSGYARYTSYSGSPYPSADVGGTWRTDYRFIGDGIRQYYYTISVNGRTYYYVKGSNRVYYNFSDFKSQSGQNCYSVQEYEK